MPQISAWGRRRGGGRRTGARQNPKAVAVRLVVLYSAKQPPLHTLLVSKQDYRKAGLVLHEDLDLLALDLHGRLQPEVAHHPARHAEQRLLCRFAAIAIGAVRALLYSTHFT